MLQGALDGRGVGSNEVINRIVSAGSPRGNHLIFCPSVKRLEMGEGVIRERERDGYSQNKCTAIQIASMRLALASVLPETLSRKQLC